MTTPPAKGKLSLPNQPVTIESRREIAPPITKDRLVVVESVYHLPVGRPPTMVDVRFSRFLFTEEQARVKRCKATPEWAPFDTAWLSVCSVLVVENLEGKFTQKIPTLEIREEASKKVLEISFVGHHDDCFLVRPGESFRASPKSLPSLRIRSVYGEASYQLTLIPS